MALVVLSRWLSLICWSHKIDDQPPQQPTDLSILYTPPVDYYLLSLNCSLGGRQRFEISAVFRVSRSAEAERFANCGVPGNHYLLWHGTKTANMIGILQQGLRIAPPEASRSGWSLGKVGDSVISDGQFPNLHAENQNRSTTKHKDSSQTSQP